MPARAGTVGSLLLVVVLLFSPTVPRADDLGGVLQRLNVGVSGVRSCASATAGATRFREALSTAATCATDRALAGMLGAAVSLAEAQGQAWFGERFHVDNQMRTAFSGSAGELSGELDAVVPIQALSSSATDGDAERAFFLQAGVSRWRDGWGVRRNDVRHGVVRRFPAFGELKHGAFGLWAFAQQNLERGHERLVAGMDYAGRWGDGAFSYYLPATGWRPGRPGHEERVLEGMEFALRIDATDTIGVRAATSRWAEADGSAGWRTRTRLGLEWRPHPWLRFGGNWNGTDSSGDSADIRVAVAVPLGVNARDRPRWKGIGVAGGGTETDATALWRTVDSVGRMEVAERSAQAGGSGDGSTVSLEFLQGSADTGGTVRVGVALSSPALTDTRVQVWLVPGSGDNPAVPGEDFVDGTKEVLIAAGGSAAELAFELLDNPSLKTARSLSVKAAIVG